MILREIAIGTGYKSRFKHLYESFICMSELYSRVLLNYKFNSPTGKFVIIFLEEETNKKFLGVGIYEVEILFDFEEYIRLSSINKRVKIIEVIHNQLIQFAEEFHLDKSPVEETFQKCKEFGYENKWIHRKKSYISPKKDFKIQLECEWDETHLHVFIFLYDKSGEFLLKHKWFDVVSRIGYTIYSYKGSFIDDYIFDFRNEYLMEKWKIDIRDLFKNR